MKPAVAEYASHDRASKVQGVINRLRVSAVPKAMIAETHLQVIFDSPCYSMSLPCFSISNPVYAEASRLRHEPQEVVAATYMKGA